MEIKPTKNNLLLRFLILYAFSIGILFFLAFYLLPRSNSENAVISERPLKSDDDNQDGELLSEVEAINKAYLNLKEADRNNNITSGNTDATAENRLNNILDSVARIARSSNTEQSLRLQNFVESFRQITADRSAMNAYRAAVLSPSNAGPKQDMIVKLQADIQIKNEKIAELNDEIQSLNKSVVSTVPIIDKQQNNSELAATIAAQQRKITSLMGDLKVANAEKNKRVDDSETDLTNQKSINSVLEQKVSQLTADLRISQADCNINRADANKIISNSRQRKQLLSEALSILNTVAATGDASTKSKVAEKLNRLNSVASAVHD